MNLFGVVKMNAMHWIRMTFHTLEIQVMLMFMDLCFTGNLSGICLIKKLEDNVNILNRVLFILFAQLSRPIIL